MVGNGDEGGARFFRGDGRKVDEAICGVRGKTGDRYYCVGHEPVGKKSVGAGEYGEGERQSGAVGGCK